MSNIFLTNSDKYFCESITLDKAELNKPYVIIAIDLPPKLKNRFAELGLVVGTTVTPIKTAPLGDPVELNVMGYLLCARAKELKHFVVKKGDE